MGQTLYYRKLYKPAGEKVPGERDPLLPEESSSSSESRSTLVDVSARTRKTIRIFTALSLFLSTTTLVGACLYFFGDPDDQVDLSQWHLVPQLLGWASALLYCCSRIPQIMQNFKTESVDGLSILMFIFSVTGNVTYCVVSGYGSSTIFLLLFTVIDGVHAIVHFLQIHRSHILAYQLPMAFGQRRYAILWFHGTSFFCKLYHRNRLYDFWRKGFK